METSVEIYFLVKSGIQDFTIKCLNAVRVAIIFFKSEVWVQKRLKISVASFVCFVG